MKYLFFLNLIFVFSLASCEEKSREEKAEDRVEETSERVEDKADEVEDEVD